MPTSAGRYSRRSENVSNASTKVAEPSGKSPEQHQGTSHDSSLRAPPGPLPSSRLAIQPAVRGRAALRGAGRAPPLRPPARPDDRRHHHGPGLQPGRTAPGGGRHRPSVKVLDAATGKVSL